MQRHDGLGHLQFYSALKPLSIVCIAILFAKFIPDYHIIHQWESILLLGTSLSFFYVSGMGYTLVSFVKRYEPDDWPKIFGTSFIVLTVLSLLSSLALIYIGTTVWKDYMHPEILVLYSIFLTGSTAATVLEYELFVRKSFRKLFYWGGLNFLAYVLLPTLPLLLGYTFIYSFYALAILGLVRFLVTLSFLKFSFGQFDKYILHKLYKLNLPVILSLLTGTGYVYLTHFILQNRVSEMDFNLFRYGSRDFPFFLIMANSFSIVLGGITASEYPSEEYWKKVKRSHLRLMHQLFPAACIFMFISPVVFSGVFNPEFKPAFRVFNILLLTLIPRMLFPQSILLGISKTKYNFYASVIEFAGGMILVYLFLPVWGILGAALAICLAFVLEKLILIAFCYKEKISFLNSMDLKWYLFYSTLLILSFFTIFFMDS
ncbi:MAG: polysaccharide biosynthesis C-terminal domain-containing protein [Flavobacteriales bacterium]|nr:polysaccharide biosynthesis C-terminal domain-containing protein [Flavobacteriales bacterium]